MNKRFVSSGDGIRTIGEAKPSATSCRLIETESVSGGVVEEGGSVGVGVGVVVRVSVDVGVGLFTGAAVQFASTSNKTRDRIKSAFIVFIVDLPATSLPYLFLERDTQITGHSLLKANEAGLMVSKRPLRDYSLFFL